MRLDSQRVANSSVNHDHTALASWNPDPIALRMRSPLHNWRQYFSPISPHPLGGILSPVEPQCSHTMSLVPRLQRFAHVAGRCDQFVGEDRIRIVLEDDSVRQDSESVGIRSVRVLSYLAERHVVSSHGLREQRALVEQLAVEADPYEDDGRCAHLDVPLPDVSAGADTPCRRPVIGLQIVPSPTRA